MLKSCRRIVFILAALCPALAAAVPRLIHMSSDQRVHFFERFQNAQPTQPWTEPNRHPRFIKVWIREHQELFRANDAMLINEMFDLFLRRQGLFSQEKAFDWLAGRLIATMTTNERPHSAATRDALRMYIDVALIFSAAPISRRLTSESPLGADWIKANPALDALAYAVWRNPVMKQLITRVARSIPGAPVEADERARWFFAPYFTPCAIELESSPGN